MDDDNHPHLERCDRTIEEIKKAVFEENLTLANLKRRIARIIREYQHRGGEDGK